MTDNSTPRGVAIVTGAGSGIGRASSIALMREGYAVGLAGRRQDALDETLAQGGDAPGTGLAITTDVTDPEQVEHLFDAVVDAFGRIDLLFNNAGMGAPIIPLEDLTVADWQAVVDVNLTGSFLCLREAFKRMKAQEPRGGRIINNGSISAYTPRPYSAPYTATKHAITGLTKAASLDGRAYDIKVGQLDIGNAATPLTKRTEKGHLQPDGSVRIEPKMDVENVARAVVHMASLPPDANVQFMTVMAHKMPYVGRG